MRARIISKVDIKAFIQDERRKQRVYGELVRRTSDECDLTWQQAKEVVNKDLKLKTLGHLLKVI
jgi:hypothetical protein